jgi:hypothetical protein
MKMKNRVSLILAFVFGLATLQAQQFVKMGGQATDIAINPKDGKVFVVSNKNIFTNYNTISKRWSTFSTRTNKANSVSVTRDGAVYMVSTAGEVFIEVNRRWIKVPGIKTAELIASKDGRIYAIDFSKKLRQLYRGQWNQLIGQNRISNGLNQVIGIGPKELYARASNNAFTRFSGGKWSTQQGYPLKIALDHANGNMYAVGQNRGIYKWNKQTKRWDMLPGNRSDFKDVAVHNDAIWAIATDKSIYRYKPRTVHSNYFEKVSGTATDVTISAGNGKVYTVSDKNIYTDYDTRAKRWKAFGPKSNDTKRIAIGPNNTMYRISTANQVGQLVGSRWNWMSSFSFDIATDSRSNPWVAMKSGGDIQSYRSVRWMRPLSKVIINVSRIAPLNDYEAWVIMKDNTIQRYKNGRWQRMPGKAIDIAIDIRSEEVYIVNMVNAVAKWNNSNNRWDVLSGSRADAKNVAANFRKVWITTTKNEIYYYKN